MSGTSVSTRWWARARTQPCAVLLLVQLAGILVYPVVGNQPLGRTVFGLFGLAVLGLAVYAVRATPALSWVAVLLGLPVLVLTVLEGIHPGSEAVVLTSSVAHGVFYLYTGYALIRYMFDDHVITTDELWATGATFTVFAWAFAYLYVATQIIWPDSFTAAVDADDPRSWMDLLFLSVTTLTSTGLSDIVPIRPQARSLVMIEQIAGMLYLAMVVARVTALTIARAHRD